MVVWIVLVLIVLAIIAFGARARRDSRSQGYPYIRGTDYYRRSVEHKYSTVVMRLNQGLPPHHDESMWRDPSELRAGKRPDRT